MITMSNVENVIVVVFSIGVVVCGTPLPSHIIDNVSETSDNKNYSCDTVDLPCEKPQSRVFHVAQLVDDENLKALIDTPQFEVYPHAFVLQRCEASGCCENQNHRCSPKVDKLEEVKLTFEYPRPDTTYCTVTIVEVNHTECECRDATNDKEATRTIYDSCKKET